MIHTLSDNIKPLRLPLDGTTTYTAAAGTTDLTSEGVDTLGFAGALFRVKFGTLSAGAVTSIYLQQSDDNGVVDGYSDIANSRQSIAETGDGQFLQIDMVKPMKRWLTLIVDRGTGNAVVDDMEVELYNPVYAAPAQDATHAGTKRLNSPGEGTP